MEETGVRCREVRPSHNPVPVKLTWRGGSVCFLLVFGQQKSNRLILNEKHDILIIVKRGKEKHEQGRHQVSHL